MTDKSQSHAVTEWRAGLTDPVRDDLLRRGDAPDLDRIRQLFPPTTGDVAFDPAVIRHNTERLVTTPEVNTGHPFLDLSVRTGLAFVDATFQGDHPKYGVKYYGDDRHDGFPPTIIAAVDALTAWGLHRRAAQLFQYWLINFVNQDGTIRYYGPSLSEYGQVLHTAVLLYERAGPAGWWDEGQTPLSRMADHILGLCANAEATADLVPGIPEADIAKAFPNNVSDSAHSEANRYFHNNAWIVCGLSRWSGLLESSGTSSKHPPSRLHRLAHGLAKRTLAAIEHTWPADSKDWWLSPQVEPGPRPDTLTATTFASYTNYRYWPELLSSGLLPPQLANRLVEARLSAGGQFCGMTRFLDHLDDWTLADYLQGLWQLGRKTDFLLSLYGHVAFHQAGGHLTAYEQVTLPPMKEREPYCLPCQLVAARTARFLFDFGQRGPSLRPAVAGLRRSSPYPMLGCLGNRRSSRPSRG
jgi:hypothetical protein